MTTIIKPTAQGAAGADGGESDLGTVRTYDFCVSARTRASSIVARFEQDPGLPGVIVERDGEILGVLSRQVCLEHLSLPFGSALFRDAPVEKMFDQHPQSPMVLTQGMSIQEAVDRCLARPRDQVYAPAIVKAADGRLKLLSMYDLIVTQSRCLVRANRTIQEQIRAVEEASRAKGTFLANMSHEIRTPMNAVLGMADLLLDTSLTPRQREYLGIITEAGQTLLAIINDILDFSKIEAGKLALERTPFDLQQTIGDTAKSLAVRAHRQGLELAYRCAAGVPERVVGDPMRLRQVLFNLLGNAIKFTQTGEVVLEVDVQRNDGAGIVLLCRVVDTGVGIPADKLTLIFEAFEQADTSTTRNFGGTGLGLAISSRLVQLMGGEMWVQSEPGRGSVFSFTVRCEAVDDQVSTLPSIPTLSGVARTRVLLVDDNRTNLHILKELYAAWGMIPLAVASAADAMALLVGAADSGTPIQLVVSDVHMPGQSGVDLVQSLRAHPQLADTSVLLLSSSDAFKDANRGDQLDVAGILLKPVTRSELLRATLEALGAGTPAEKWVKQVREVPVELPRLSILVAEDNVLNQRVITEMLTRQGHSVTVAANGREAAAQVATRRFDLVLMDVQMPEMDGFEATALIRQEEQGTGEHVPIIAITAHAMKDDGDRCLRAGMDHYVSKPIRADALGKTMQETLLSCGRLPPLEHLPTPEPPDSCALSDVTCELPSLSPASESSDLEPVDWEAALAIFAGNKPLLMLATETFLEERTKLVNAVREAIARRETAMVENACHCLKGALRYFGPTEAGTLAQQLEFAAKARSLNGAADMFDALDRAIAALVPALDQYLATGRAHQCVH